MERCLGIISYKNTENNFGVLCNRRSAYMLPYGGRYRVVDFALSNMVNHNIRTVAVYTGDKVGSTMDHLGNGKPWELNRRINGLFIFPPQSNDARNNIGDIYQYHITEDFFLRSKEEYVFIVNPNIIGKIDITKAYKYFRETDADMTLLYKEEFSGNEENVGVNNLVLGQDGSFINIGVNLGTQDCFNMFLEAGFFKKDVFLNIIKKSIETGEDLNFRQAIIRYKDQYKVNSYEFKGHIENIRDIKSYYDSNMNLLNNSIFKELFFEGGPVYTKSKDEPPTMYSNESSVDNSLIANGCIIKGRVENSIIHRGVTIGENAIVKNSIIMQKCDIGDNAFLLDTILDKHVMIGEGVNLIGTKSLPYTVEKNIIINRE